MEEKPKKPAKIKVKKTYYYPKTYSKKDEESKSPNKIIITIGAIALLVVIVLICLGC